MFNFFFYILIVYKFFYFKFFIIFFSFDTILLNNLSISNNIICPDISPTAIYSMDVCFYISAFLSTGILYLNILGIVIIVKIYHMYMSNYLN